MRKKDGRGRPKKAASEKGSCWIGASVTVAQKREFVSRARAALLSESDYLRRLAGVVGPATNQDAPW